MLPECVQYAIVAIPIAVILFIVGKAIHDKRKGLQLVK